MTSRDRRKASDIFNETNYPFAKKVQFAEAYPDIATLKVVVEEKGEGVYQALGSRVYSEKNVGEFVDCSNSLCYNGGVSIGSILRSFKKGEEHYERTHICKGYEGSPKGRRKYRSCLNTFKVTIDISYKKGI